MATGPKAGLYQNAQSASYLPPTLVVMVVATFEFENSAVISKINKDIKN